MTNYDPHTTPAAILASAITERNELAALLDRAVRVLKLQNHKKLARDIDAALARFDEKK